MIVYARVQARDSSNKRLQLSDLPGTKERRTEPVVASDSEEGADEDPEYVRIMLLSQQVRQPPAAVGSNHVVEPFATACRQEKGPALKAYHAQKQLAPKSL